MGQTAAAQRASEAPLVETLGYHNIHISVPDPAAARAWYSEHLGAADRDGVIYFGEMRVSIVRSPEVRRSEGSVIDHIGISYPDVVAKTAELEAAGATVLSEPREAPGFFEFAYIEDPWGVKIELVEDSEWPGFHHIHLSVSDPTATLDWYEEMFGGTRDSLRGRLDGVRHGGIWLFANGSGDEMRAPSQERSLWSLGWIVPDLDAATEALRKTGVPVTTEPTPYQDLTYAFFLDPNGVSVELLDVDP
jgi:catechol 2,3-dioxygenase-like lactoylglutathione lyase family enzyme